jgi:hypothetical protein
VVDGAQRQQHVQHGKSNILRRDNGGHTAIWLMTAMQLLTAVANASSAWTIADSATLSTLQTQV